MRVCIWLIDCLDKDALDVFKASLKAAANITQLTRLSLEDVRVGLCCVRFNSAAHLELKFLLKPESISLPIFHAAVDQLQPSEKRSDAQKLAAVLKKVVERLIAATHQLNIKGEIMMKEIHVVSKALDYGEAMTKLLRMTEKKDIHIRFHAFIDDSPMVHIPSKHTGIHACLEDGHTDIDESSLECTHERFAMEVNEMEHVSFRSTIGSTLAIDRMVMSWMGDCIKSNAYPLTLCFHETCPELRFPCVVYNRHLDLISQLQKTTVCSCHNAPIQRYHHRCSLTNTVLQPQDCKEHPMMFQLGDSDIQLSSSSLMERLINGMNNEAVLFIRHRCPKEQLNRHHLGSSVEIHYDALTDDEHRDFFHDLCKATMDSHQVLIADGIVNLHHGSICHFLQHYALVPSQDGSLFYAFWMSPFDTYLSSAILQYPIMTTPERIQKAKERLKNIPLMESLDPWTLVTDVHVIIDQLIHDHQHNQK